MGLQQNDLRLLGGGLTPLVGHAPFIEHVLDSKPRKYSKPKPNFHNITMVSWMALLDVA
jgi:hypothetical protein